MIQVHNMYDFQSENIFLNILKGMLIIQSAKTTKDRFVFVMYCRNALIY